MSFLGTHNPVACMTPTWGLELKHNPAGYRDGLELHWARPTRARHPLVSMMYTTNQTSIKRRRACVSSWGPQAHGLVITKPSTLSMSCIGDVSVALIALSSSHARGNSDSCGVRAHALTDWSLRPAPQTTRPNCHASRSSLGESLGAPVRRVLTADNHGESLANCGSGS